MPIARTRLLRAALMASALSISCATMAVAQTQNSGALSTSSPSTVTSTRTQATGAAPTSGSPQPAVQADGSIREGSTVRTAPGTPAACSTIGDRWNKKRTQLERIGQGIYQSPPSVKEISCLDNLLNAGGNLFFSLPDLSGLLDQIINAICRKVEDKFLEMTRPLEESLYMAGDGLELPGGIYIGGPKVGLRTGIGSGYDGVNVNGRIGTTSVRGTVGADDSSRNRIQWNRPGSSGGTVPTISGPFSGYNPTGSTGARPGTPTITDTPRPPSGVYGP